jgi:hypothetical protein
MPAGVCFPPAVIDSFKQALISGKINPENLAKMTSEERHAVFSEVVGEGNAKFTNAQFESKLLLKDQQRGYLTWAKKLTGISQPAKRDLISRIERMDKVLNPAEEKAFMKDLASTKLGVDVTVGEAKKIANMSARLQKLEALKQPDGTFRTEDERMAYGRAKVAMGAHLAELKNNANKLGIKASILQHPADSFSKTAGFAKALKASLDNSAIFRQGWKTIWTNPISWQRNARKSFIDIAKQLGGKETLKEVQADIVSRPNAELYNKMKLAIGNVEEEFPTTLPEKIPLFGRVYKASEGAYTGFLYRQRADIADHLLKIAKNTGVDINDPKQLDSMGKLINSLTGRGHLGSLENRKTAATLNNVFFSIRFLKSNVDTLTAHQLQRGVTPFVRKQAAMNLLKIIAGTASILAIAKAHDADSVELDPHSANFGKIKVGHTSFDVSGGMNSIVVLATRLGPLLAGKDSYTKSSTTGVKTPLNKSMTGQTGMEVLNDFFENKVSPATSIVRDMLNQKDFNGNKPTVANEAKNTLLPFPINNAIQEHDPYAANKLLSSIADGLGISASTINPKRNLDMDNLTKTQTAFKNKIGEKSFIKANDEYNKKYNEWLAGHQKRLKTEPEEDKPGIIEYNKQRIQKEIYSQYDFKPSTKSNKTLLDKKKSYAQ